MDRQIREAMRRRIGGLWDLSLLDKAKLFSLKLTYIAVQGVFFRFQILCPVCKTWHDTTAFDSHCRAAHRAR